MPRVECLEKRNRRVEHIRLLKQVRSPNRPPRGSDPRRCRSATPELKDNGSASVRNQRGAVRIRTVEVLCVPVHRLLQLLFAGDEQSFGFHQILQIPIGVESSAVLDHALTVGQSIPADGKQRFESEGSATNARTCPAIPLDGRVRTTICTSGRRAANVSKTSSVDSTS